eukprot:1110442-Pleurochrysis_carterae.AAC.1
MHTYYSVAYVCIFLHKTYRIARTLALPWLLARSPSRAKLTRSQTCPLVRGENPPGSRFINAVGSPSHGVVNIRDRLPNCYDEWEAGDSA